MIRGYKQEKVLDTPNQNHTIYRASKDGKIFLMHEFESVNESDEYTYKIRKKLNKCSHLVQLVEEFEEDQLKYYIQEFIELDLLKLTMSRNGHVLPLTQALEFVARLIEVIQELHGQKLVYRNIRPEKIRFKNTEPYLYDFQMSQFMKRKERMFEIVGVGHYLAPQYFSESGYGQEVDIWAIGVLLYYLLIHDYPFKFKSNEEAFFKQQFMEKCSAGYRLTKQLENIEVVNNNVKGNKLLEDFFKKIFQMSPSKRITITEIKEHPLFEGKFAEQVDKDMLEVIQQFGREESVFLSKMYKFPCSKILHKEEIILDFIEQTAELFLLECPDLYPQDLRYKCQFCVLKIGLIKCNTLLDIFYAKKQPYFKIDPEEWQMVRKSTALGAAKEKIERKKKILHMLYKNAFLNVQEQKDPFFREQIPQTFQQVKVAYRSNLSEMFELGRKQLVKTKGNRMLSRKLTETLVRVIIMFLVNRLFQHQQQISIDFAPYFEWSKKKDLQDMQEWIETEEVANLKIFMKTVTSKYL